MAEFEKFKKKAEENQPALTETSLKKIQISEDLFTNHVIKFSGKIISVTDGFIDKLFKIVNLSPSLKKKFEDAKQTEALGEIIKQVKDSVDKAGNMKVYLVANPNTEKLVNIALPDRYNRITNQSMVDVIEDVCNRYGLEISGYNFDSDGRATVNLRTDNQVDLTQSFSPEDEIFKFGLTFQQKDNASQLTEFAMRMVCANGMFGPSGLTGDGPIFKFGNNNRFGDLLSTLDKMNGEKFVPKGFMDRMKQAHMNKASVNELEAAFNWMLNSLSKSKVEPTMMETYKQYILQNYAGDLGQLQNEIKSRQGKELNDFNVDDKRQLQSETSVWDLINNLTYFGSHKPVPMDESAKKKMQMRGGQLFASAWDAETRNEQLSQL